MLISHDDLLAIYLSVKLALITTLILLMIAIPLAWWLTLRSNKLSLIINTLCTTPLVLPPSVIGFYLLVMFSPTGIIGKFTTLFGIGTLSFTFSGLVIASVIYSLPFVLQPIQTIYKQIGRRPLETALMLGASPTKAFIKGILPQAKNGIISAALLGFAHTVGEFGIVLMIGGNITDKTQVVSIQIYNHVEAFEYHNANSLALIMLSFGFTTLFVTYCLQIKKEK